MRFLMLMYPGIEQESDWTPSAEAVAAMTAYNQELTEAGILLALDGLHPSSEGARVTFSGGKPTVVDGPFAETKELVGGYWIIQTRDKEEAVAWAARCPTQDGSHLEVRRIFEMSDFPADVQAAGQLSQTPPAQTADNPPH